jgi:ribosome-associated protein
VRESHRTTQLHDSLRRRANGTRAPIIGVKSARGKAPGKSRKGGAQAVLVGLAIILFAKEGDLRHLFIASGHPAGDFYEDRTLNPTISGGTAPQPIHQRPGLTGSQPGTLVRTILTALDDLKGEDVVSIDLHGKTTLADVMIIATGRSNVHVGALAERVITAFKDAKAAPRAEGLQAGDWVLIDGGDVIVHIFRPEVRQFYNLEKMWGVGRPGELRAV